MSQRTGSEDREGREVRLPVVARWAELTEERRRPGAETAARPLRRRLVDGLRSVPRFPFEARDRLRRRRLQARPRVADPPRPSADDWLEPILVDCLGRDGSTLMMRLLASSPEIAVGTNFPYEDRYFTYLWRWSRLLDRADWPSDVWGASEVCSVAQEDRLPLLGPPPWLPRDLMEEDREGQAMSSRCFELAWQEFSRRARGRTRAAHHGSGIEARYYAEKHLDTWNLSLDELPPVKLLVMLRDPRDVWVSKQAFELGRPAVAESRAARPVRHEDLLRYQIAQQRDRLRWIAELLETDESAVVRYEDLLLDLPGVADRIERRLQVSLDSGGLGGQDRVFDLHATSEAPETSIGRWRTELDPAVAEQFAQGIGAELRALGFQV